MISAELIKLHNHIEDIAEKYYTLTGTGNTLSTKENPSLKIYINTQSYYDFGGSNDGGSVIDLVMNRENIDFIDACKMLSDGLADTTPIPQRDHNESYDEDEEKQRTEFTEYIKNKHKEDLTPIRVFKGLEELYPFIDSSFDTLPFQHLLGYSTYHNSITFEMPNLSIIRKTKKSKWVVTKGNTREYIPNKINKKLNTPIYLYSGIAEIIACEAMGIEYIGLQSDSSDKHITKEIIQATQGRTVVIIQENDKSESSQRLSQRLRKVFNKVKIIELGSDDEYGFDLRDFTNKCGSFEVARMTLDMLVKNAPLQDIEVREEIVINYDGKYISDNDAGLDIGTLDSGVVIASTGSGKTHSFSGKAGVMILVPRVLQADTVAGDDTDYVIGKTEDSGTVITYNKFMGHYGRSKVFKNMIDSKRIKVVVDEAHTILVANSSKEDDNKSKSKKIDTLDYELIYNLDAIFVSGTLEDFFRPDLQRYKFKPKKPLVLHYTSGLIPDVDSSLYFVDRANLLMQKKPLNCVVGRQHNFNNYDLHTHKTGHVFSTCSAREGLSLDSGTFDACIVIASSCGLWSTKDIIQGLNRVRGDGVLRAVTKQIKQPERKYQEMDWWLKKAQSCTETKEINTIMGEEYSKFIKKTHKPSRYHSATGYGVACYLADRSKNNYDEDLYTFEEYTPKDTIVIDTKLDIVEDEEIIMLTHRVGDDMYRYPSNKREPFMKWARHKESGLVDRLAGYTDEVSFHKLYRNGRIARDIKTTYNAMFNRGSKPHKYSIDKFLSLVRSVVKIEMKVGSKVIRNLSKNVDLKDIHITVKSECPIEGVKRVIFCPSLLIKEQAKKCTAKPVHSVKTANEMGRPRLPHKTAPETVEKTAPETPPEAVENSTKTVDAEFESFLSIFEEYETDKVYAEVLNE